MKASRTPTWSRLRVYFGTLLLGLFTLGGLVLYASSRADPTTGRGRGDLRALGIELMALAAIAGVLARALGKRLWND